MVKVHSYRLIWKIWPQTFESRHRQSTFGKYRSVSMRTWVTRLSTQARSREPDWRIMRAFNSHIQERGSTPIEAEPSSKNPQNQLRTISSELILWSSRLMVGKKLSIYIYRLLSEYGKQGWREHINPPSPTFAKPKKKKKKLGALARRRAFSSLETLCAS